MRFDIENQLCAAQAFTGAATVSASSYGISNYSVVGNKPDMSIGRRMSLLVMVTVAAGGGSTHVMEAIQATDAALTTSVDSLASLSFVAATLVAGYAFEIPIPQGSINKLFLGFRNTATGGTTTVTLDVYLVPADEIPKFKSFPKVVDAAV